MLLGLSSGQDDVGFTQLLYLHMCSKKGRGYLRPRMKEKSLAGHCGY
jgi:hypothetical protein